MRKELSVVPPVSSPAEPDCPQPPLPKKPRMYIRGSSAEQRLGRLLPPVGTPAALGILLLLVSPALALINPNFTPADLVRSAGQIVVLEVGSPKDGTAVGRVVEMLKGAQVGPVMKLTWDADELDVDEVAAAFAGEKSATAIVFLLRRGQLGVVQIGTQWFSLARKGDGWMLGPDKEDRFSVWAGSAGMLARAARYAHADPRARFPVRSDMTWGADQPLGKLPGKANGCIVVDFGAPLGLCTVALSEGGDRVFGLDGRQLADVTAKSGLTTRSRAAAPGDFDGDGRIDLATWDGKGLTLALQSRPGAFTARAAAIDLKACNALACAATGAKLPGLLASTDEGPVLLVPEEEGRYTSRPLAAIAGGLSTRVDIDADGASEVVTFTDRSMAIQGSGAAQKIDLPLVKSPSSAVFGDYDADGQLDVILGGRDGLVLVTRDARKRWRAANDITGELAYHGNANRPAIVSAWPCEINNDGRQGVAMLYPNRNPMFFFNRGFACFGLARELELSGAAAASAADPNDPFALPTESKLKGAAALEHGQSASAVADFNGDGVTDLVAADAEGGVWALLGAMADRRPTLTVALPPSAHDPVTLAAMEGSRITGMYIVRPGIPASITRAQAGPVTLKWNGQERTVDLAESTRLVLP